MLTLQQIGYTHPNKEVLFTDINLSIDTHEKAALIGNNGAGKSTLLKIISGDLEPGSGTLSVSKEPYYVPQIFGQYNHLTLAQALRIDKKLHALNAILEGDASEQNFSTLDDDWTLEERCREALQYWQLPDIDLHQPMATLSGGQKTKVFLAGVQMHQPELILLDEPSNHLDLESRILLYQFVENAKCTILVTSHDRKLLNLLNCIYELQPAGIKVYGGNYDFFQAQKQIESQALTQEVLSKEKSLKKARDKERETAIRQQKLDSRGKSKQEKAGVARIMMNTLRNSAEQSSAKLKSVHAEKITGISQELTNLRNRLPDIDQMKFGFDSSNVHPGKVLFNAAEVNYSYDTNPLWKHNLNVQIRSGERIAIKGPNGSGKTTLIKMILGVLQPSHGDLHRAGYATVYIDQEYSLIDHRLSVYDQAQQFNTSALQEHEVKIRLSRFLFDKDQWNKPCSALSGGESMRLILCCLSIQSQAPDIIVLDEPTNNLDIRNIEILAAALNDYRGTLIIVSHDESFLDDVGVNMEFSVT